MENIKRFGKIIPYIIIVLLVCMLGITQCQKHKARVINYDMDLKHAINREKARVIEMRNREVALIEKIKQDRLKNSASASTYKSQIKALKREIAKVRIVVDIIADTIPSLEVFLSLNDSLISAQEGRIDSLSLEKIRMYNNFNLLLTASNEKFKASNELVKHYEQLNKDLERRVRRERFRKTAWKVASGILAAGIIYQVINN